MPKSNNNKHKIIERAIEGGIIGAALGALLTKKGEGTMLAALVGMAIGASLDAQEEIKNISTPFMYKENGKIYKQYADGRREFVKNLSKTKMKVPQTFNIG